MVANFNHNVYADLTQDSKLLYAHFCRTCLRPRNGRPPVTRPGSRESAITGSNKRGHYETTPDDFETKIRIMDHVRAIISALQRANWSLTGSAVLGLLKITWTYWCTLYGFVFQDVSYKNCPSYQDDQWARVQIFSLSLIFKMWSLKHYRSPSFQQDMLDNLRNVAIPGTGIPLSIFCYSYWTCLAYVFMANPLICLAGAVNKARKERFVSVEQLAASVKEHFTNHLLHPDDWFSFWRLNCRLVSYHSGISSHPDYQQEDKWTFLTEGRKVGVPVSPFYADISTLVCKNKNIEGGMGIHFFRNAAHGGDWILQERLENADWLNALLPGNAPLSTMRVITTSSWALRRGGAALREGAVGSHPSEGEKAEEYVRAESGVLRLGRANASTDHSSVLFDVNISSGKVGQGTSNAHWYQLGLRAAAACPWLPPQETITRHADAPFPEVTGQSVPHMQEALRIVTESHFKLMPNVPIVGWDVAFTPAGVFLLEVNLSCNFFKGKFDVPRYIDWVDQYWQYLSDLEGRVGMHGYRGPRPAPAPAAGREEARTGAGAVDREGAIKEE